MALAVQWQRLAGRTHMPVADLTANAEAAQPHWRHRPGHDVERWFDDSQAMDTGGILLQPTWLTAGQYYYRFASSTSSRSTRVSGGWWIDFEIFHCIEALRRRPAIVCAVRAPAARPAVRVDACRPCAARDAAGLRARPTSASRRRGAKGGADRGAIPPPRDPVRQQHIPAFVSAPESRSQAGMRSAISPGCMRRHSPGRSSRELRQ
ncbi:MAG: hypothetical protein H6931_01955 [Burkholderiaceae bacterium]|nr:hypothetical protein [Burkholderiaceae bacterium]